MYYTIGTRKPIACSQCGSLRAVKPVNEPGVALRCLDCGHQKLDPTPPTAAATIYQQAISTAVPKDSEPTF